MALRPLLQYQNPDSTRDMNDRFRVFNKGVFAGGDVTPATGLTVRLSQFATVGSDGMFVREDDDENILSVLDGVRTYIVIRQLYRDNEEPIVSIESLPEANYVGDPEPDSLIVFAVVDVPLGSTDVLSDMIEFFERDVVDPLGRLSLRGQITNIGDLPNGSLNANRAGDFYAISNGAGDYPELWAWNGVEWLNITLAQTMLSLLEDHINNLSNNALHLTNLQFEAVLGTVGTPSDSNRYVTSLDPRIPTQNENDAMFGDSTILSDNILPSDTNRYVVSSKVFATPVEKAFGASATLEITDSDGPVYVGLDTIGTAQRYFNIFEADTEDDGRDKELINSQSRSVRVTGVYTESSLSLELNPGASSQVDMFGFFSGGSLFMELSDRDPDNQADVDCRIVYAKRTSMKDLSPQSIVLRGPESGQVDARVNSLLARDVGAQFVNAEWDGTLQPGEVAAFNSGLGRMVPSNLGSSLFPVGLRGNANNLITAGIYDFPSATIFSAGDEVYADNSISGALSTIPNEWYIGVFLSDTKLLVNMNAIGLSSSVFVPGVAFPGSLFDAGLLPGEVAGWNGGTQMWERWDTAFSFAPEGLRGNSNNIIQVGAYVPGGSPYGPGQRFYAVDGSGALTTSQNDYYVGRSLDAQTLLVNISNSPNWEDSRQRFSLEHDAGNGRHEEGSARTWVGLAAQRFSASGGASHATGMVFVATDTGQVFYCTNGATDTWVETTTFSGPISVGNTLEVASNLRLPTGILDDTAGDTFDVFSHATRHLVGGNDPLSGVVNQILSASDVTNQIVAETTGYDEPKTTILTLNFDFTGRPGLSTVLFFAPVYSSRPGNPQDLSLNFFLDGVEMTPPNGIRVQAEIADNGEVTVTLVGWSNALTAAAHTLEIRMGVELTGRDVTVRRRMIMGLDLGLT